MVLELAEQDLKSHLSMRRESGALSDHVIIFFWTEMLACVKVIHDRSKFYFNNTMSFASFQINSNKTQPILFRLKISC